MEHHYYIGEGLEAEALAAEVTEKEESFRIARKQLCAEYDADGLVTNSFGAVVGLAFEEKQNIPYLKGETRYTNGYGYSPKRNCKAGKELAAKLNNPDLAFSASDYIVKQLDVARTAIGRHSGSRTGTAMFFSVAGIVDGKILVSIPVGEEDDCMPAVPAWLREVKKSEWLAVQGK